MIPYLICFLSTILFTYIAEINFKKKRKIVGIIFSICAILIPSIMAGIRDMTIGSDTSGYPLNIFNKSKMYNNFKIVLENTNEEFGFVLLGYVTSLLTSDIHYYLFFIELITMSFIYLFAYYKRDKVPMCFFITIYMLMCYSESLCIMRQHIALAIFLYSIKFLEQKKYIRMSLLFLLSTQLHTTAVVGIIIYILYILEESKLTKKKKNIIYCIIISCIIVMIIQYSNIVNLLIYRLKILPERYSIYFAEGKYYNDIINFSSSRIIFKLFWLMITIISFYVKKVNKMEDTKNEKICILLFIIDILIYIFSLRFIVLSRMSYFLFYPAIFLSLKSLNNICKKDTFNQIICYIIIISIFIVYFYVTIVRNADIEGGYNTYPYRSDIIINLFK